MYSMSKSKVFCSRCKAPCEDDPRRGIGPYESVEDELLDMMGPVCERCSELSRANKEAEKWKQTALIVIVILVLVLLGMCQINYENSPRGQIQRIKDELKGR